MSYSPHDALIKAILGEPRHAVAALQPIVPVALRDALDWSALRRENASYVSVDGGARHSDLLFTVPLLFTPGQPPRDVLIYVLLEHQSSPDPIMPVRLFVYVARLFEERVLRAGLARVPLVVSVVLSHTERPWVEALSLDDLYDAPRDLLAALDPLVPRLSYALEDLTAMSRATIHVRALSKVVELTWTLLRDARSKTSADLLAYASELGELLADVAREDRPAFVSLFLYLVHVKEGGADAVRKVIAMLPPEAQEDIVSAYDSIRAESKAEGEAIGVVRGKAEGKAEGKVEGRRTTLAKQLQLKFGPLGDDVRARLDAADDATLELWIERVLFATTLEQLFAP